MLLAACNRTRPGLAMSHDRHNCARIKYTQTPARMQQHHADMQL